MLDRIARPIRRYLRDREDTVKVIVSGLLADPATAASTFCSRERHQPDRAPSTSHHSLTRSYYFAWNDGFDSKETFVKEMQTLLADRLIQKRQNYDQEVTVLADRAPSTSHHSLTRSYYFAWNDGGP
jgi:anaphase-promoting complex subunit 2